MFLIVVSSRLFYLSTRLTFSYIFHGLADRAQKVIYAIVKLLWSVGEHSPSVFFYKLFDSQIQPILRYG